MNAASVRPGQGRGTGGRSAVRLARWALAALPSGPGRATTSGYRKTAAGPAGFRRFPTLIPLVHTCFAGASTGHAISRHLCEQVVPPQSSSPCPPVAAGARVDRPAADPRPRLPGPRARQFHGSIEHLPYRHGPKLGQIRLRIDYGFIRGATKIRGVKIDVLVKDTGVSGHGACESRPGSRPSPPIDPTDFGGSHICTVGPFGPLGQVDLCYAVRMGAPDGKNHADLATRLAALEERMKTMQAEYKTDIALLAKQNAERDTRIAERDTANTRWLVGSIAVAAVFIVAVLGLLIRS